MNSLTLPIGAMKVGTTLGGEMGLPRALSLERKIYYLIFAMEDIEKGSKVFLEKRPPEFREDKAWSVWPKIARGLWAAFRRATTNEEFGGGGRFCYRH